MGRPSIDPKLMIRMLIVGYCFGIRSELRLCDEVLQAAAFLESLGMVRHSREPSMSKDRLYTFGGAVRREWQASSQSWHRALPCLQRGLGFAPRSGRG